MTVHVVRMPYVVHLEAERMLQVVARLLVAQPGNDGGPLADVYYPHVLCFWQRAGDLVNLVRRGHPVRGAAQAGLANRAEIA
jgi:hypothetical protein